MEEARERQDGVLEVGEADSEVEYVWWSTYHLLPLVPEYISSYLQGLRRLVAPCTSLCTEVHASTSTTIHPETATLYALLHIHQKLSIVATRQTKVLANHQHPWHTFAQKFKFMSPELMSMLSMVSML